MNNSPSTASPMRPLKLPLFALWVVVLIAFQGDWSRAAASDQIPGQLPEAVVAIVGGTVHPVDSPVIAEAVVLVKDGMITAVGPATKVEVPAGAIIVDAVGLNVYPGLINAYSDIGLREIDTVGVTVDNLEVGRINPNVRSWVAINPDSELIPVARSAGVLTSLVAPGGPYFGGQAGVVRMDGWTPTEMLLLGPAAVVIAWDALEPRSDSPEKRRKARAESYEQLAELLAAARRYAQRRELAADSQAIDLRLDALLRVVRGELPIIAAADRREAIEAAVGFAAEHDLKLIIYGGHDAAACADLLRQSEVPVILPGTYRLPLRRDDPYDAPYTLPARLHQAGVQFCIAAERSGYPGGASNARNLPYHAGNAVAYGLSQSEALRAITLSAAEILGVDASIGSLTSGKEATLLVVKGDMLQTDSHVRYAMIHGRPVDLGNKQLSLYRKYEEKYRRLEK